MDSLFPLDRWINQVLHLRALTAYACCSLLLFKHEQKHTNPVLCLYVFPLTLMFPSSCLAGWNLSLARVRYRLWTWLTNVRSPSFHLRVDAKPTRFVEYLSTLCFYRQWSYWYILQMNYLSTTVKRFLSMNCMVIEETTIYVPLNDIIIGNIFGSVNYKCLKTQWRGLVD